MNWRCTGRGVEIPVCGPVHQYVWLQGHTQVLRGRQGTHLPLCPGKERGDEHGQIRHPAERIQKREEDAGCVLPDVPFHGESETGSHSGS